VSHYRPYPAYKESGVEWLGRVPEHWAEGSLRHFTTRLDGERIPLNRETRSEMKGDIPYWGAGGIVDSIDSYLFDEKLVLLGEDGAPFFDRFRPVAFVTEGKVWINNHIHVLRVASSIRHVWLMHCLNIVEYQAFIDGSTRDKLTQDDMKTIPVVFPSTHEQDQILRFLDRETARIDGLIEKKQRLIELLKEMRQAVITRAVTKGLDPNVPMKDSGVEWLGEVPEHWKITKVGWLSATLTYGFTNPMPSEDDGPKMLTANDIGWGLVDYENARSTSQDAFTRDLTDKSRPKRGDLLITKDGTLGRVATHDGRPACINQSVALLRVIRSKVLPDFLASALLASVYQDKMAFDAGGTTIKHIYISRLAKMEVAVPNISEQQQIVDRLSASTEKIDTLTNKVDTSLRLLLEHRSALITAAVTGQIDVRDAA
jgi:type I restriction enzyme S subunit